MPDVDAPVAEADAVARERQMLDAQRDGGLSRVREILVVRVPPHQHGHAVSPIERGERVDLLRHAGLAVVEASERPGMARIGRQTDVAHPGEHPVGVQHRLLHALGAVKRLRVPSKKRSPSK